MHTCCHILALTGTTHQLTFSHHAHLLPPSCSNRHNASAEKADEQTFIELNDPVALTFALRYLNNFGKVRQGALASAQCAFVNVPMLVSVQKMRLSVLKKSLLVCQECACQRAESMLVSVQRAEACSLHTGKFALCTPTNTNLLFTLTSMLSTRWRVFFALTSILLVHQQIISFSQ